MKKKDKQEDIIKASLELIAEHGFHGVPMSMIAQKAGVGAGTIYRYFENKDVLIKALYRYVEDKIIAALMEGYSDQKPIRERFIFLCTRLLKYFVANPLHFRFMEQYYNSPYGTSLRRDKFMKKTSDQDAVTSLFEEGVARQVLKDLPLFALVALTFSPLVSLARDHNLDLIVLDDDIIMKSIEACWDGIKRNT